MGKKMHWWDYERGRDQVGGIGIGFFSGSFFFRIVDATRPDPKFRLKFMFHLRGCFSILQLHTT